jgi:hypothetical protein
LLGDLLGDLLGEWLIAGAKRPERAQLLFYFAASIFGLLLSVMLLFQYGSTKLLVWPEGSFYALMFATFAAIPGLPVGVVSFVRYRGDRRLSAACTLTSLGTLLVSAWLWSR